MCKYIPGVLLLVLVVSTPTEALAQRGSRNSVELTPFVGFRFGNSLDVNAPMLLNPTAAVSGNVKLKDSISYGFVVDVPLNEHIAIEALYTYRKNDISVRSSAPEHVVGEGSAKYIHGGLLFTLNPHSRSAMWFLVATLGVGIFGTEQLVAAPLTEGVDSQSMFSFGFGAGVKVPLSDSIRLRGEFRGFSTRTDLTTLGWICGYYTCSQVRVNQYFWEGELRVGLEFGF